MICWMAAVISWMDRHAGDGEGRGLLPRPCIPCMALESLATEACVLFPAEPRAEADELVALWQRTSGCWPGRKRPFRPARMLSSGSESE